MSVHSDRRRKARLAAAVAAGLGGLAVIRSVLPAGTPPIRVTGKESAGRTWPIATLEKVRLGGSDQWVLERSEDVRNPVLLYLHGGPGTSQLTSNRRNTRHLERYFTVVNWDQRGAGKSYRAIGDTGRMNIGQFVADTRELTVYLLAKFGQERLVLAGHSWGSVIAALTVAKYPGLYSCYVGIGQVARMEEAEEASYRWTLGQARKHGDRRAVAALLPPRLAGADPFYGLRLADGEPGQGEHGQSDVGVSGPPGPDRRQRQGIPPPWRFSVTDRARALGQVIRVSAGDRRTARSWFAEG